MYPNDYTLFAYARLRNQDFQAEAERRRLLRLRNTDDAGTLAGLVNGLRRAVGNVLVRAGERLEGPERRTAQPASSAGDIAAANTQLRLVR
jgi:hypothetical protein